MKTNYLWIILCAALLVVVNVGWNIPLRISVAGISVLILVNLAIYLKGRLSNGRNEEKKNSDFIRREKSL